MKPQSKSDKCEHNWLPYRYLSHEDSIMGDCWVASSFYCSKCLLKFLPSFRQHKGEITTVLQKELDRQLGDTSHE